MKRRAFIDLLLTFALVGFAVAAEERFPPPEFTDGHVLPETLVPSVSPRTLAWVDVALLVVGLGLASWFSLKLRSRMALVGLSVASLIYFGFWRQGCVCAIGSMQNVALGVADSGYGVPLAVIGFFVLPLIFALIWGRGFCGGVCPHGALQDLVLLKAVKVPKFLDEALRLGPWLYLSLAVLFAATGGLFLICKFDPFVGIFRMNGSRTMLLAGAGMLVLSMFVGRPYCRYLCPYGALLGACSRVAKWRPEVTPTECSRCRLCEDACPYGAIDKGLPAGDSAEPVRAGRKRISLLLVGLPLAMLVFGWLGSRAGIASIAWHPAGELAMLLDADVGDAGTRPDELVAFYQNDGDRAAAFARAAEVEQRALRLGWVIGALFGAVALTKTARAFFPESSPDYVTDRGRCVSCARCYSSCPYELQRRGIPVALPEGGSSE